MSYFDSFFNKKQATRLGLTLVRRAARQSLAALQDHGTLQQIIEVGPGRGMFGQACLDQGIGYTGVECNAQGCETLRSLGLEMVQALVPPFPDGLPQADAFVAMHVIEHMITLNDAIDFVQGARALLRDQGLILLVAPDIRYAKEWYWCCNYSHNYVTSTPRLVQLLQENGFEILKATVRTQSFFYPWSHLIWMLTWLAPYKLFDFFCPSGKKNRALEAKISFTPSAFVIARKT